ncbi:DUF935 family protein [Escherichia coli]
MAPLVQAIQEGRDADEAMNVLAEAWPELPDETLRQLLTQAFFVADIWGRTECRLLTMLTWVMRTP